MLDNVGNLQYADRIQSLIVCFSNLIGHVHVNLLRDGTVRMSELAADGLDRDTGLRHEGRIGMTERVHRQR